MMHMMDYKTAMSRCANIKEKLEAQKKWRGPDQDLYYPMVYRPLLAIDYSQKVQNPMSTFRIDRTFTWLDWSYAE